MIRNSFIFLDKIGPKKEKELWSNGIKSWDDFINAEKIRGISGKRKIFYNMQIRRAKQQLYKFNSSYFADAIPLQNQWRLYDFFKDEAVFLDIETTGLSSMAAITVIGLYDGINTKTMIKGINLDFSALKKELQNYKLIVTFNGSSFDLPFISKRHPGLIPKLPHFDLKHACAKLGLTGGLKAVEKKLGIRRNNEIIEKFNGGDAITLWRMFRATGDDYYIKLLVEYNEEDIINLKQIADYAYSELKKLEMG